MFKRNPGILKFISRLKVDAPLSSADVKFLINQRREAKFAIATFLWALIAVHRESTWVCKGDCWPEDWLICFICMGT